VQDQVVILTGATSGLGERMAESLHERGARLVLAGRRVERLDDLAARLPGVAVVPCDVAEAADRERLVVAAVEAFGRVDGLINNAGVAVMGRAMVESVADFRRQLEVNLLAPFALSQRVVPEMRKHGGGAILNVASVVAVRSFDMVPEAGYVASKAGLAGLTRELASQWGRYGIRVNALGPGFFRSEMTDKVVDFDDPPAWMREMTPLGRTGEPPDLDGTVAFFMSPENRFVTGQLLVVDGGITTR
jgi:NAD(P)-dependent dehydrogenase (short-subunit alcohol dehydrogenase family)